MSIPVHAGPIPIPRGAPPPSSARANPQQRAQYAELKANVHKKLLNRLNLEALAQADRGRAESEIRSLVGELLAEEATPISFGERDVLFGELVDEVFGLGPLEPLLRDPTISDILVNTYKHVFVERNGMLGGGGRHRSGQPAPLRASSIGSSTASAGASMTARRWVDARLTDGSRVNAIVPPLAIDGPLLSIRRFPAERLKADDLVTLRR